MTTAADGTDKTNELPLGGGADRTADDEVPVGSPTPTYSYGYQPCFGILGGGANAAVSRANPQSGVNLLTA
jgi:hypothetical protein